MGKIRYPTRIKLGQTIHLGGRPGEWSTSEWITAIDRGGGVGEVYHFKRHPDEKYPPHIEKPLIETVAFVGYVGKNGKIVRSK